MTSTHTVPVIAPTMIEDDGAVVAVTLSWPSEPDDNGGNGVVGQAHGLHIIELIGDIDLRLAMQARGFLTSLASQPADFTVDVSRVRFIDAAGLGVLAALHRRVSESGGHISVIGASPSLRRCLRITQLTYLLAAEPPHS